MAFTCPACGNSMEAGDRFCRVCGKTVAASPTASPAAGAPPVPTGPPETSGKAVASLVLGLLFFVPFAFIAAIVFGHIALSEIKKSAGRLTGEGMAIAGLVLGYLGVVFIPITLIIAAIAIPNLLRARIAANESSAVGSIRILNTAEISYSAQHPDVGYTCALSDLSSLVDSKLASGEKNGYVFELSGCTAGDGGTIAKYQVVASPATENTTGTRTFCSDESAVIRVAPRGSGQDCFENGTPLQ